MSDENRGKESAGKGGDLPEDLAGALTALKQERANGAGRDKKIAEVSAESAGKDRRITEYGNERKGLLERIEKLEAELDDKVDGRREQLTAMAQKAGELSALEETIRQKQEALNFAIEKKISIPLAVGNAARLPDFKKEVEGLYEDVFNNVNEAVKGKGGWQSVVREHQTRGAIGLANLRKMGAAEIAKLPKAVLDRLAQER